MTRQEFDDMIPAQRLELLLLQGTELMSRIYIYFIVKLYFFDGVYAEVWYVQTSNKVHQVMSVELDDVVHLYEKNIDIDDLFR